MRPFWPAWPRLKNRIRSSRRKLLLLDFDGTLTPIVRNPDAVAVDEKTRNRLKLLSGARNCVVAVVSGRSLKDLKRRFSLSKAIYVGNHGLELAGRGLTLPPAAKQARGGVRLMRLLEQKLESAFCFWPGVTVENKVYTVSLHFRNLNKDRKPAFNEIVDFFKRKSKKYPVAWRKGKKVWEIRPVPAWNKGDMALYLAKRFPSALPIAVGDDQTDEDMFRALKNRGITVRIGRSKGSGADYYLNSQKEVGVFLEKLCF